MPITADFKAFLDANRETKTRYSRLFKLQRFLEEKREQGVIPRRPRVLTIQEIERYGYDRFVGK